MSEIISIPILELMEKTEQWLLNQGYKKNTLGVYKATWNKFRAYSSSPFYDRETAEKFLLRYFGVDANAIDQKLDMRMRHARRHMSALDEFLRTGEICRRKIRGITTIADDGFDLFFSRFLDFCREQNYSKSWLDNTISGLRIFLLATHVSNTSTPEGIDMDTINCFSEAMRSADEICMNVRRMRCRQVAVYLHWLYQHGITKQDYSLQLPEFKRTPAKLPQTWSKEEIEQILAAIDTENPTGKRNYAMFLLMARTGLRISDIRLTNPAMATLTGKGRKARQVPLMKETCKLLDAYIRNFNLNSEPLTSPLFFNQKGQALSRYGITYILKKYVSQAELDSDTRKISPHVLRHTKAMHLLRAGVNMIYIRDFLGHVDISTTEVYARIDAEMKRKVFEEKVPNFTPNTTMPWEEDKDLLQWLTKFGKKSF